MSILGFVGSIPELYDRHMGPVLFEPYAREVARRLPPDAASVLEVAAGTGRLTRQLLAGLPAHGQLAVTDLNPPMLDEARRRIGDDARVTWRAADMQALPFADATFDAVACAFGLMFAPDKPLAMRELRRVLRPGGVLVLSTWGSLATNPASARLHELAVAVLPSDPPAFMAIPFSLHDAGELRALAGDFASVTVEAVEHMGEAESASHLAAGFVRGNPLYNQLVERGIDAAALEARVTAVLAGEFGDRPCRTPLSANVLVARA